MSYTPCGHVLWLVDIFMGGSYLIRCRIHTNTHTHPFPFDYLNENKRVQSAKRFSRAARGNWTKRISLTSHIQLPQYPALTSIWTFASIFKYFARVHLGVCILAFRSALHTATRVPARSSHQSTIVIKPQTGQLHKVNGIQPLQSCHLIWL